MANMTSENLTEDQTVGNVTKTKPNTFYDPAMQLVFSVQFYSQYVVVAIVIFGAVANALVLYALIAHYARDAKKRAVNLLIINQNLLDLASCLLLLISFAVNIGNVYLTGTIGDSLSLVTLPPGLAGTRTFPF